VVGPRRLQVGDEAVDDALVEIGAAVAPPVDVTCDALGDEVAIGDLGQGAEMDVGKMGEPEHEVCLMQRAAPCQRGGARQ